jgi:hypothetical protein
MWRYKRRLLGMSVTIDFARANHRVSSHGKRRYRRVGPGT